MCSGNGVWLHILIEDPVTDEKFFVKERETYKFACKHINMKLKEAGIPGKADPSVFSPKRIARMPCTTNKKDGRPDTEAYVIQPHMELQGFNLSTSCGAPKLGKTDTVEKDVWRQMGNTDTDEVLKECRFLQYSKENQATLSEPEWYTTLGIVGFLKKGKDLAHEFSHKHPGYTAEQTDFKVEMATKTTGPRTCNSVNQTWGKCHTCPHFGKITTPCQLKSENFIETEDTGFYRTAINARTGAQTRTPAYEDLIKYYRKTRGKFFSPTRGVFYTYSKEKKHWSSTDEVEIKNFAYTTFNPAPRSSIVNEALNTMSSAHYADANWMSRSTTRKLNMQNGVLDLETLRLHAHSDKYGFMSILPYAYDENAKCPKFEKFLNEVTCDDKELYQVLLQYMGYALSGDEYKHHKALILLGRGRNGKSTLNNILKAMVGEGYYSTLDIKALQNDQHRAMLEGKLFNVADENSPQGFVDTSIFKCLSSGGEFTLKEVYKKSLSLRNKAKLIFNCNELPQNVDTTSSFYERLLIVPFNATFLANDPKTDPDIENKMKDELPGILNICLNAYRNMGNRFLSPSKSNEVLAELREYQDEMGRWAESNLVGTDDTTVSIGAAEMHASYRLFCEREGIRYPRSLISFSMAVASRFGENYRQVWSGGKGKESRRERKLFGYVIKKGF
jgi:putative DNA primase/helicase